VPIIGKDFKPDRISLSTLIVSVKKITSSPAFDMIACDAEALGFMRAYFGA